MSLACRYRLEQCGAPQRLWGQEYSPHTKKKKKKKRAVPCISHALCVIVF